MKYYLFTFFIFSIFLKPLKSKSTQMIRLQKGYLGVSFNNTLLNFGLRDMSYQYIYTLAYVRHKPIGPKFCLEPQIREGLWIWSKIPRLASNKIRILVNFETPSNFLFYNNKEKMNHIRSKRSLVINTWIYVRNFYKKLEFSIRCLLNDFLKHNKFSMFSLKTFSMIEIILDNRRFNNMMINILKDHPINNKF